MGEAKTRAERRRAEREASSSVVTIGVDETPAPPMRRYRQKLVDFMPETYDALMAELALFNEGRDEKLTFDGFVNGLVIMGVERERVAREVKAEQAKLVQAVPANVVDQVLAKNRAAMAAKPGKP